MADLKLEFKRLGEDWVLLRFGHAICDETTERVRQAYVSMQALDFVCECIPTYTDLAIRPRGEALLWGGEEWRMLISSSTQERQLAPGRLIEMPVRFAHLDDDAFDLQSYSQQIGLSIDATIAKLLATEFKVAMIGFLPGMPYFSGLPEHLHLPRRQHLATAVPGTFAIGGQQAGFLPNQTLTGWWRLGATDASIFTLEREPQGLFQIGDRVRLLRAD
ncbi:MAG: 5-oxoprolinase subunit B family protein [Aequoribacter sp.]|uniref:5-oxoprolinase subunit B family protein n=1 Tax=Aequoribacter sp. TaxID=2847771 RepID=UPI003C51EBB3